MTTAFKVNGIRRDETRLRLARLTADQLQELREGWITERGRSHLVALGIAEADAAHAELSEAYRRADDEWAAIVAGMSSPVNPSSPAEPTPADTLLTYSGVPDADLGRHRRILRRLVDAGVVPPVTQEVYDTARQQVLRDEGRRS